MTLKLVAGDLRAVLTTERAGSSYRLPVLYIASAENVAYGAGDVLPDGRVAGEIDWKIDGVVDPQEADLLDSWREYAMVLIRRGRDRW